MNASDAVTLHLSAVPAMLRSNVREAFAEGDAAGMLRFLDNTQHMRFVQINGPALVARGIYESALVHAFTMTRLNNAGSSRMIDAAFSRADRAKLRTCGDALPGIGPFIIYRGRSGNCRRTRGLSWSLSLECACWFACRYRMVDRPPVVFRAMVTADEILFYYNGREEQEVVVKPLRPKRMLLTTRQIQLRANKFSRKRGSPGQIMKCPRIDGATGGGSEPE